MDCIRKYGQQVEKLDKTLIDHHIAELDYQISCQLDAVMHHPEFQRVESLWRGLKQLVDNTDYRQNVKTEILDISKDDLAALELEKQALLEDIALGNDSNNSRFAEIGFQSQQLSEQQQALESQYHAEKLLLSQLLESRADISKQAQTRDLQTELAVLQQNSALMTPDVDVRTVATVIADWTDVPLSSLMKDEQAELLTLEVDIGKRVVGQDAALNAIAQRLRASKTGLTPENGPQGVFLLTGPSGTGKTETALVLADSLYGGEKSLITINLSEYQEPHTVSQLKGSPPGYVGYGQGGILTEAVRKRPYSVVLLDEVEKAHRDVMNLFYQVFDRGFMRDGEGREIDFRNTVILMASNLGSGHIMQLLDEQPEATESDLHERICPLLRDHFQPALLARFQTVIYRPLAETAMHTIVAMKLNQVSQRLHRHYGITTTVSDSLYDALTAACLLPDTGARNIDSLLNQQILQVLSQQLLTHMAARQKPQHLTLEWDEEEGIVMAFGDPDPVGH
ncbi:AAA family ATPase [Atlantibacter hermannii]|uniref:AAA family ATPase n=1 Tax=Atlantibacter hermannii TaxID=565 RepID=UPI0028ADE38C|nr:AAA family ATPase [Atlantibacter hermannii]